MVCWPTEDWATLVALFLTGPLQAAYLSLDPVEVLDYTKVKGTILDQLVINPKMYRQRVSSQNPPMGGGSMSVRPLLALAEPREADGGTSVRDDSFYAWPTQYHAPATWGERKCYNFLLLLDIHQEVGEFCASCPECQLTVSKGIPKASLIPLPVVGVLSSR